MTRGFSTLSLAAGLCWAVVGFAQSPAPVPGASTTLTATVTAVDAGARMVEVVTGVGPALRVVKLGCGGVAEVKTAGGKMPLAQLKQGDLVRVEYAKGTEGNTARTIEALPWPGGGR